MPRIIEIPELGPIKPFHHFTELKRMLTRHNTTERARGRRAHPKGDQ